MSSYIEKTVNPDTHEIEMAEWLDDHFGSHEYGVRFPSTGVIYKASDFEWIDDAALLARRAVKPTGMVITKEQTVAGKRIETTVHEDGRRDVTIGVNTLDVEAKDPETAAAKQIIEDKVLPAIANKQITVTVIHKPTTDSASFVCARKNVYEYALKVVKERGGDTSEYCLVQYDGDSVMVTTL